MIMSRGAFPIASDLNNAATYLASAPELAAVVERVSCPLPMKSGQLLS
jgi:hypothetical protein